MRDVLLLSDRGVTLGIVHWTHAMTLMLNQERSKVTPIAFYGDDVVVHSAHDVHPLPSVIMLRYREGRNIPYTDMVKINKKNVLTRDDFKCQYCGEPLTMQTGTIDHIVPQSRGGRHEWTNIVASCKPCNNKKNDYLLKDVGRKFDMFLRKKPRPPKRDLALKRYIQNPEYAEAWKDYVAV